MSKVGKNFSFLIPVITFAVLVVFMAGCERQEKAKLEENKALIRRSYEEVWHQGNLDIIDEIFVADFISHEPAGEIRGVEGLKQFATMFLAAFPDVQITTEDQIAEGDKVVTRWTITGTHKGEFMGIPPTGVKATWTGISIGRAADDKAVEVWFNWDNLGMLQQLGVIPAEEREDFKWGEPSEVTGDPGDQEENKALVHRLGEEFWNQWKLDVIDEIFDTDYILHDPVEGEVRGPEGFKQYAYMFRTAFPDVKFTIEDIIAEGDKVAARWTGSGTHKGDLMGIPPTGVQGTLKGMDFFRIAGGKISELWANSDDLGVLQQLGVIPPMGQGEE